MRSLLLFFLIAVFLATVAGDLTAQPVSWQQLNGPHGGTITSFGITGSGYIIAGLGINQKGVHRSTDYGWNWHQSSSGIDLTDRSVDCVLVDDSGHVFIGTNSHIGGRIYKSTDEGLTWNAVSSPFGAWCLALLDSGHIYAAHTAYAQSQRSTDGGYTWNTGALPEPEILDIAVGPGGKVYLAGGTWRSTDNGHTWTRINTGLPDQTRSIAIAPNGTLFTGTWGAYESSSGVYRSTDDGDHWTAVKLGFRVAAGNTIEVDGAGQVYAGTRGRGIWTSSDNGDTWSELNNGLGHRWIKSLNSFGHLFSGTEEGGIYMSTNGGSDWMQVGVNVASVKGLFTHSGAGTVLAAVNGVSRSLDNGAAWAPFNDGLDNYDTKSFVQKNDGTIFCGAGFNYSNFAVVLRLPYGSETWERADAGIPWNTNGYALAVDADDNVHVGTAKGVYKSTDNGLSWYPIGPPGTSFDIRGIAFNAAGDQFMASWQGHGVYRRLAADTVWTQLTSGYAGSLYIAKNGNVYVEGTRSTDNGATWASMGIPVNNISGFAENSLGHLFAGTYNYGNGVYRSTDHGATWNPVNDGLPVQAVFAIAVDSDGYVYAGTSGSSIYKTTTSTVTSTPRDQASPAHFRLDQNYPNPFNPATGISYQVAQSGRVKLSVYDLIGREVAVLVDERKDQGSYDVAFDASGLPTGVYLYRLTAGEFVQTRKMVLLR